MVSCGVVVGRGWTVPPPMPQDALWKDFFAEHYAASPAAGHIFRRSGVVTRHGVADPRVEDLSGWSTAARMRRFVTEALPLGKGAVTAALDDAGLPPAAVEQLTVVSCTGYATPGVDVLLARDLGLPASTERLHVGHMGCYAAIPALATAADAAAARGRTSVLLCLELTTLHIQPPTDDTEQVVAHALFSDAAAALVVVPGSGPPGGNGRPAAGRPGEGRPEGGRHGLALVDVVARTDTERAPLMTWDVTDLGFRMGLSPRVPDALAEHVRDAIGGLVRRHGLAEQDVAAWAIHPGGPRIVDVVAERLGLDDDAVASSRLTLAEHGNCSSATVLLILDRILDRDDLAPGDAVVAMAFGPGLTLYAALLRVV